MTDHNTSNKPAEFLPHSAHPSGAEQDRYGAHFNQAHGIFDRAKENIQQHMPHRSTGTGPGSGSGAEQDVYSSQFGAAFDKAREKIPSTVAGSARAHGGGTGRGAEQDLYGARFSPPGTGTGTGIGTGTAIGLMQAAVVPSFSFQAAFSTVAYGLSRYTDRAEGKDWAWPTGMTANAWWSALGTKVLDQGLSIPEAWATLSYSEKLLLGGVTAWGARLLHRIATRGVRRGKDDARYEGVKKEAGFWDKAFFTMFLPEAVAQTFISLPFVLPFRAAGESLWASSPGGIGAGCWHSLAVFVFSVGFAMEALADSQLERHKERKDIGLCRDGVWSVVRHPNYLGDALIHISFPILLLGSGLFHPLAALGPVANYVFLRFIGGDKQNEESQAERYAKEDPIKARQFRQYQEEKNSFWPSVKEIGNRWSWVVVAAGVGGVLVERGVRGVFLAC
ncbi:hypothetical protein BJX99DRAFT_260196 [Aspergillus californicus]